MEAQELPEWVEVFDPASGSYYFWNQKTFESSWEAPPGWSKPEVSAKVGALLAPELKAALLLQGAFRAKQARRAVRRQRAATSSDLHETVNGWQKLQDPSTGYDYYFNPETEEVSWDPPAAFAKAETILEDAAQGDDAGADLVTEQETAPAAAPASPWCAATDESSGETYYYNVETNEATWDKPEGFDEAAASGGMASMDDERAKMLKDKMRQALEGKLRKETPEMIERMRKARAAQEEAARGQTRRWCEAYDDASDAFYYYDVDSYETVWEKPPDFVMSASDDLLKATLTLQGIFRGRLAQKRTRLIRARQLVEQLGVSGAEWVVLMDKGAPCYVNVKSEVVAWEKPVSGTVLDLDLQAEARAEAVKANAKVEEVKEEVKEEVEEVVEEEVEEVEGEVKEVLEEAAQKEDLQPAAEQGAAAQADGRDAVAPKDAQAEEADASLEKTAEGERAGPPAKKDLAQDDTAERHTPGAGAEVEESTPSAGEDAEVVPPDNARPEEPISSPASDSLVGDAKNSDTPTTPTPAADKNEDDEAKQAASEVDVDEANSDQQVCEKELVEAAPKAEEASPKAAEATPNKTASEEEAAKALADRGAPEVKNQDGACSTSVVLAEGAEEEKEEEEEGGNINEEQAEAKEEAEAQVEAEAGDKGENSLLDALEEDFARLNAEDEARLAEKRKHGDRFKSNKTIRANKEREQELRARIEERKLIRTRLEGVQMNVNLTKSRLTEAKQLLRKTEAFIRRSDDQLQAKIKSVMQSFRVAELASRDAVQDLNNARQGAQSEATAQPAVLGEVIDKASKSSVFFEAQVLVAMRSFFSLFVLLLDSVEEDMHVVLGRIEEENLDKSRRLRVRVDECAGILRTARMRVKHVQIHAHRNFVTESLQKERHEYAQARAARGDAGDPLELVQQQEHRQYADSFEETVLAAAENEEAFDTELGFLIDRFAGNSPWWASYFSAMKDCQSSRASVAELDRHIMEMVERFSQQREGRLMLAEEAYTRAIIAAQRGANYEYKCRQRFIKMCRASWKKGLEARKRDARRRSLGPEAAAALDSAEQETSNQETGQDARGGGRSGGAGRLVRPDLFRSPWDAIQNFCALDEFAEALEAIRMRRMHQEKRGFDIDAPDRDSGRVLLHLACWYNRLDIVNLLLQLGANPNAVRNSRDSATALHIAARAKQSRLIAPLVQAGASICARDSAGDTALHWACRVESLPCARALLDGAKADPSRLDDGDDSTYWQLLAATNDRGRLASELLPRSEVDEETGKKGKGSAKGGGKELSYTGQRVFKLLRDKEIEAQQRLVDAEVGEAGGLVRGKGAARANARQTLAPLRRS